MADLDPILSLKDVAISFPSVDGASVLAVKDVNFHVNQGEFLALVGPSGCGKSTVLNALAGLIAPSRGNILCNGKPLAEMNPHIGYISQADTLLPWNTVLDNVALGLKLRSVPKKVRYEKARDLLSNMGLSAFEQLYPHELSGGMKKRATIARVLAIEPDILFMDEPFAPLDAFTREKLQEDILQIWDQSHQTIVYITHDLSEAIFLADRVLLMSGTPGKIQAEYPIHLPRPRRFMDLKFTDDFISLETTIWSQLRSALTETRASS